MTAEEPGAPGADFVHFELRPGMAVYDTAGTRLGEVCAIWERTATGALREVAGVEVLAPPAPPGSALEIRPGLPVEGYLVVARGGWRPRYAVASLAAVVALGELGVVLGTLHASDAC
ncbi:MAG TPA: hypothetical protein VKZ60_04240 [Chloroflexota bacterium]|jgi:hypothetical protein|nr:hypothetical protein [Chloroflexota bacterium]